MRPRATTTRSAFSALLVLAVYWGLGNLLRAAEIKEDPLCVPKPALDKPRAESASNDRMASLLQELSDQVDPSSTAFFSDRLAMLLREAMRVETNHQRQVSLRFQLSKQLLQAGRTEESLRELKTIENAVRAVKGVMSERGNADLRMQKALGLIRLGEQENCQRSHTSESCIFPLRPAGFHQLTHGSRGAVALLNEQLKEFPDDLKARWLLNIAQMTLGEWPDQVPENLRIGPRYFASEYAMPRFPDVAVAVGLAREDLAGGCIVDDFDNDGFLDVVVSSWGLDGQLRYYHNEGDGSFGERTTEAGLSGLTGGLNIQQTDYNNDGWLDVWVLRGAWLGKTGRFPKSLLRNNGDGTFTDVTVEAHLMSLHPSQTSAWFDYDGDGWLDVFIGNETLDPNDPDPCELFHNNRDGTFTECAAKSGISLASFIKGVTCADYDHDGRPDLYLSDRLGENFLFHNEGPNGSDGQWNFKEVGKKAGVTLPLRSFATWFFDYDNDGWEDLFVSGYGITNVAEIAADYLGLPNNAEKPKLYHNNHDGTFTDVTETAHLNRVCHTMGCNFGDLDNDGWLDFYVGTGDPDLATLIPNRMFRNAGGKFFQEVTETTGTGHLQKGHAVSFADIDNDGDQDIYTVIGGALPGDTYRKSLFMNPGAGGTNHWLKLKLVGVKSNRSAIGARIKVTVSAPGGERSIHKTVNIGSSFGANPLRQELGLGNATGISSVEVSWPATGERQTWTNLSMDRAYQLREGDATAAPIVMKKINLAEGSAAFHNGHSLRRP